MGEVLPIIPTVDEEEAVERQREAGRFDGRNPDGTPKGKIQVEPPVAQAKKKEDRKSAKKAADTVGVGKSSVKRAKKVAEHPDLADRVRTGE